MKYIPREESNLLPATVQSQETMDASEKEKIVRMLWQLKNEVDYLKDVIANLSQEGAIKPDVAQIRQLEEAPDEQDPDAGYDDGGMSLKSMGNELIEKVLRKHGGNRKAAAAELGISERTLYRKLKK